MNDILKFHIQNNYYVKVSRVPKTKGCIVVFPQDLIRNYIKTIRTYIITDNDEIEIYNQEDDKIESSVVQAHKINIRLLLFEDILLRTLNRGISRHLIKIEGEKNLFTLLDLGLNKEELEKENSLCLYFRKLLIGKVENDVSLELEKPYLQIVECFENGGL